MAMMMGDLYDALRNAGADDEHAKRAAQEVAAFENAIADLRSTLKLHSWMLGFNLALSVAILWRVFAP